jgi:hypothetical protein
VTDVTATSPLSSSGGATPDISLTGIIDLAHGGTQTDLSAASNGFVKKSGAGMVTSGSIALADLASDAVLNTKYVVAPSGHPYSSIQAAVTAAEADTTFQAIYVLPGVYAESVTITKPGIQVFGVQGGMESQGVALTGSITVQLTSSGSVGISNIAADSLAFTGSTYQRLSLDNCRFETANAATTVLLLNATGISGTFASNVLADRCSFSNSGGGTACDIQAGYLETTNCYFSGTRTGFAVKVSAIKSGSEDIVGANIKFGEMRGQVRVNNAAATVYPTCYLTLVSVTTSGAGYYPVSATNGYVQLANVGLIGDAGVAGAFGSGVSVLVHALVSAPQYGSVPFYSGTWFSKVALPFADAGGDLSGTYPNPTITVLGLVDSVGGPYAGIPTGTPVALSGGVLVSADAADASKMPAIGIYTGSTTNRIRTSGAFSGLSGLTADAAYYVASGGGLTTTPPSGVGVYLQRVGESISTTSLFVTVGVSVLNP